MGIQSQADMSNALGLLQQGVNIMGSRMDAAYRQEQMEEQADEKLFESRRRAGEQRAQTRKQVAEKREEQQRQRARRKAALGRSGTSLSGSAMDALAAAGAGEAMETGEMLAEGTRQADGTRNRGRRRAAGLRSQAGYAGMKADRDMAESFLGLGTRLFSRD